MRQGLYDKGYMINYPDGEQSLQRDILVYKEDIEDRSYTIKDGDNLTMIAYQFYKDPLKWFVIADVNEIENPFELTVGKDIIIPNLNNYI